MPVKYSAVFSAICHIRCEICGYRTRISRPVIEQSDLTLSYCLVRKPVKRKFNALRNLFFAISP